MNSAAGPPSRATSSSAYATGLPLQYTTQPSFGTPAMPPIASTSHSASPDPLSAGSPSSASNNTSKKLLKDTLTASGEKRKRNPLACESCRTKKAKCDGVQPICTTCQTRGIECVYRTYQRKAQRLDDYVKELETRLSKYEGLAPPSNEDSPRYEGSNGLDMLTSAVSYASRRDGYDDSDGQSGDGTADAMGVPGDRDTSSFFGKSAISTVFRTIRPNVPPPPGQDKQSPTSQLTPRSSGQQTSSSDDGALPPKSLADALLAAYWRYVHSLYPMLDEATYREQYERFWARHDDVDPIEMSILYSMLALGAHFMGPKLKPTEATSLGLRFFRRARDSIRPHVMADGSLRCVQALVLLCQYAQSTNSALYCWNIAGVAVRLAQGLGLHLEDHDESFADEEKEIRRRTFWNCFVLDRMVSTTFGRPTSIREDTLSTKLPSHHPRIALVPSETLEPGTPDPVEFFAAAVRLSRLLGRVLDTLYAQTGVLASEKVPLARMIELDAELRAFEDGLPYFLSMKTAKERIPWSIIDRQRHVLYQRTLNVRILLHRPSLLQHVRDENAAPPNSLNLESSITRTSALICLDAARTAIEFLHETHADRDRSGAHWYAVYHIFQGAVALLLLKLHWDRGHVSELPFLPSYETALDKATEVLEQQSNKSPAAASCYHHLLLLKQPPSTAQGEKAKPINGHAPYTTTPQFSVPTPGLNFPEPGPSNTVEWTFDNLFTSASLPLPYDFHNPVAFGAPGVFPQAFPTRQDGGRASVDFGSSFSWPAFQSS